MLQLKNVHFSERLSEETNAFTADIFFRGKKVGYAKNDGNGGCTNISHYPEQRENFQAAEEYARSLPDIQTTFTKGVGGEPYVITFNLENQVDELFSQWLEKKEIQKFEKKGIFYQEPNGRRSTVFWKGYPIKKLLQHPQGEGLIRAKILELQSAGNTILNTNLGAFLPKK